MEFIKNSTIPVPFNILYLPIEIALFAKKKFSDLTIRNDSSVANNIEMPQFKRNNFKANETVKNIHPHEKMVRLND